MKTSWIENGAKIVLAAGIGFGIFYITSHPKSKVRSKLHTRKIKSLEILPSVRFVRKEKIYHFHHWFLLSIVYSLLLFKKRFRRSKITHGLLTGGILQGLLYKDRFTFRYPTEP